MPPDFVFILFFDFFCEANFVKRYHLRKPSAAAPGSTARHRPARGAKPCRKAPVGWFPAVSEAAPPARRRSAPDYFLISTFIMQK